jgi:RNA polymerase sigma-70 factor (ECF subfamily)
MKDDEKTQETRLVASAKEGNMEAFESLVRKYQQSIYYLCRRMAGTHQAADDISQETFIKAFFALSQFNELMNFQAWLRKIAVNNSLNYLKARKKEVPLGETEIRNSDNRSSLHQELPQETAQRNEVERKFKEALQTLPPDQKSIFILRFYENLSYKEISQALNLPRGTVMSRLNRARQKLKSLLADTLLRRS